MNTTCVSIPKRIEYMFLILAILKKETKPLTALEIVDRIVETRKAKKVTVKSWVYRVLPNLVDKWLVEVKGKPKAKELKYSITPKGEFFIETVIILHKILGVELTY